LLPNLCQRLLEAVGGADLAAHTYRNLLPRCVEKGGKEGWDGLLEGIARECKGRMGKKEFDKLVMADVWSEAISSNSITEDETDDMKLALATAFYK
ncbi:hypothetical protein TrRE_jg13391, partial [Triparma retinervis]